MWIPWGCRPPLAALAVHTSRYRVRSQYFTEHFWRLALRDAGNIAVGDLIDQKPTIPDAQVIRHRGTVVHHSLADDKINIHPPVMHCNIHSESKKLCHSTFVHNFDKCWPIFKILSLLYSPWNLQQNSCHIAHHTLDVSLHYLAKLKFIIQPFSVTAFINPTKKSILYILNVIKVQWVTISGLCSHTQNTSENCVYALAATRASAADTLDLHQVGNGVHECVKVGANGAV